MSRLPYTVKIAAGVTTILGLLVGIGGLMRADIIGIVTGVVLLALAGLLWKGFAIAKWIGSVAGLLIVLVGLVGAESLTEKLIWAGAGVLYTALLWTPSARRYFAEHSTRRAVTG
jgi:hypothetical protein